MNDEPTAPLFCAFHPERETVLRCNRCEKPICYECAVRTPVGYRCKECVRDQQAVYFNAQSYDLPIAGAVALVLAIVIGVAAYALLNLFGFFSFLLALAVGPVAGGLIAEAVRRFVGRRRARYMNWVAVAAVVLGILLGGAVLLSLRSSPAMALRALPVLFGRLDVILFAVMSASTVYARLQ